MTEYRTETGEVFDCIMSYVNTNPVNTIVRVTQFQTTNSNSTHMQLQKGLTNGLLSER